jgi:2-pyrone-4,6-dicarboxylate lactonase
VHTDFRALLGLMQDEKFHVKVSSPERISRKPAPYEDAIPFGRKLVAEFGDRVFWGTDWPHPNLKNHMPDDGLLVDFIPHIVPTAVLQRKMLVDNPLRLYWS